MPSSAAALGSCSLGQQARRDRLARRRGDGRGDGVDGGDDVEHPDGVGADPRDRREDHRRGPGDRRGGQGHGAPVETVGDRAAVEARDDHRQQREPRDERDHEGRPGQVVDVQPDGRVGDERADAGEGVAEPEPCEGGADPQRREVDEVRATRALGRRRRLMARGCVGHGAKLRHRQVPGCAGRHASMSRSREPSRTHTHRPSGVRRATWVRTVPSTVGGRRHGEVTADDGSRAHRGPVAAQDPAASAAASAWRMAVAPAASRPRGRLTTASAAYNPTSRRGRPGRRGGEAGLEGLGGVGPQGGRVRCRRHGHTVSAATDNDSPIAVRGHLATP